MSRYLGSSHKIQNRWKDFLKGDLAIRPLQDNNVTVGFNNRILTIVMALSIITRVVIFALCELFFNAMINSGGFK